MPGPSALTTVMISCQQRHETRNLTTTQLQAVGLEPEIFLSPCNPAGNRQNAQVSAQALTFAREQKRGVLFVEDDLDVRSDFPLYLEAAQKAQQVTYFYVHDTSYPGAELSKLYGLDVWRRITERQSIPPGLYPLKRNWGLGNGQCIYIPQAILGTLDLKDLARGARSIDTFLWMVWHERELMPLVALPHPIQHRQVRVARGEAKPDRFSLSFDLT